MYKEHILMTQKMRGVLSKDPDEKQYLLHRTKPQGLMTKRARRHPTAKRVGKNWRKKKEKIYTGMHVILFRCVL
jgi:hypothetical protein